MATRFWQHAKYPFFFLLTLLTTTLSGAEWTTGRSFFLGDTTLGLADLWSGLPFSLSFLLILTAHEFGHYFVARYYQVGATLPLYIPLYLGFLGSPSIGTAGAFIRLTSQPKTNQEYFDIGVAGPLAGFVVALVCLVWGYTHLPALDYIFTIHPEYAAYGADYAQHVYQQVPVSMTVGDNLLIIILREWLVTDPSLLPDPHEFMHYPLLFAGYLSLLFTALNLMPVGQLDGGHVLYGLLGYKQAAFVSPFIYGAFVFYAGLDLANPVDMAYDPDLGSKLLNNGLYVGFLYLLFWKLEASRLTRWMITLSIFTAQYGVNTFYPEAQGYEGWLVFAFILGRFLGLYHPPALMEWRLSTSRKVVGWLALLIFILCFTPRPLVIEYNETAAPEQAEGVISQVMQQAGTILAGVLR